MPLAAANATSSSSPTTGEPPAAVLAAYRAHQGRTGRGNSAYATAARSFLRRWPDVSQWQDEPLDMQLSANAPTPAVHHVSAGHRAAAPGLGLPGAPQVLRDLA